MIEQIVTVGMLVAGVLAFAGVVAWAFAQAEFKRGEEKARADTEKANADAQRRGAEELVRHRTDDDVARRLRDGSF